MHVISRKKLRDFWDSHPDAESPLERWFEITEDADWTTFAGLRATFPHADSFCRCVVFDIGGNKYRLIAAIHYDRGKVFVRHVLTHRDYDRGDWKDECR